MIDRLFTALLAFCLLAGGTAAIGSAFFAEPVQPAATPVVQLPEVVITGQRVAGLPVVQLPMVTVVGQRQPAASAQLARNLAVETSAARFE